MATRIDPSLARDIRRVAARPINNTATNTTYDNTTSGLAATDVQAAIDELNTVCTTSTGQTFQASYANNRLEGSNGSNTGGWDTTGTFVDITHSFADYAKWNKLGTSGWNNNLASTDWVWSTDSTATCQRAGRYKVGLSCSWFRSGNEDALVSFGVYRTPAGDPVPSQVDNMDLALITGSSGDRANRITHNVGGSVFVDMEVGDHLAAYVSQSNYSGGSSTVDLIARIQRANLIIDPVRAT